jgi:hypothetical protein
MSMPNEPKFLRMALDASIVLEGKTDIAVGESLWLPLEIEASGARVDLHIGTSGDGVMPLSSERVVRLPFVARSVRVCVELFGIARTESPVQVFIEAVSDDGLSQGAAVLVSVL